MVQLKALSEKHLSMFLWATLGEETFKEIAEENPKRYLFG
jgi:hypothetical protein